MGFVLLFDQRHIKQIVERRLFADREILCAVEVFVGHASFFLALLGYRVQVAHDVLETAVLDESRALDAHLGEMEGL